MGNLINRTIGEFKVQAFYQGKFMDVTREDTSGRWSIFFPYPTDFTFVCPTELGDLADSHKELKVAGCEIYSVSEDTRFVYEAWADASGTIKKVQYPMLGDPARELARKFGVLDEEEGQTFRETFILNPENRIKAYEIHDIEIGRNAQELLHKVQAVRSVEEHGDQMCPAEQRPEEEMLMPSLDLVEMLQGGGGYD